VRFTQGGFSGKVERSGALETFHGPGSIRHLCAARRNPFLTILIFREAIKGSCLLHPFLELQTVRVSEMVFGYDRGCQGISHQRNQGIQRDMIYRKFGWFGVSAISLALPAVPHKDC
jgi:hypothetical protein